MNNKFSLILLSLILIPTVLGGRLTKNGDPLTNYTIYFTLFTNTEITYGDYTKTDYNGTFSMSTPLDTLNYSLIKVFIGKNMEFEFDNKSQIKRVNYINNIGLFRNVRNLSSLNIDINTHLSSSNNIGNIAHYTAKCMDDIKLEICSIALIMSKNQKILYYDEKIFNYTTKYFELAPVNLFDYLDNDMNPSWHISQFVSDGSNAVLSLVFIKGNIVNITNPYNETANGTIGVKEQNCYFNNGKTEITEKFNPNETKTFELISTSYSTCKIEYNFIKTGDINIDVTGIKFEFNLLSVSITMFSIILLSIYIQRKIKKKKPKNKNPSPKSNPPTHNP